MLSSVVSESATIDFRSDVHHDMIFERRVGPQVVLSMTPTTIPEPQVGQIGLSSRGFLILRMPLSGTFMTVSRKFKF